MKNKVFGKNLIWPSKISFGGAPIGELFENLSEETCTQTLDECFNNKLRLFDTSPFYGYGLSETRLGNYLQHKSREEYLICTKVGRYLIPEHPNNIDRGVFKGGLNFKPIIDYTYEGTMKSFYQSLERLKLNDIDIALIHDLDFATHGNLTDHYFDIAMNGAYKALVELKNQKLIKSIGVGLNDASMCVRFSKEADFDCMIIANRYSLLEQTALKEFFDIALEKNISVFLAGVFNSGILIKGLQEGSTYEYGPIKNEIRLKYLQIKHICDEFGVPIAAAALQFSYAPRVVSTLILGMDRPNQIKQNSDLLNLKIDKEFWKTLIKKKLIAENSPIPH